MIVSRTIAVAILLAFTAPAFAEDGLATVSVKNGEVWVTPGQNLLGISAYPKASYRVTNEPFKTILAQVDGKPVILTLSANGTDAQVTKVAANWAPPPYNPVNTWITGGDGATLSIDPNPYAGRAAYAEELTVGGVRLAKPAAPDLPLPPKPTTTTQPTSPQKPIPIKRPPATIPKDQANGQDFEATGSIGPLAFPGVPADLLFFKLSGFQTKNGGGATLSPDALPPALNVDKELDGPLIPQLKALKGSDVNVTGKVKHWVPSKLPGRSAKVVLTILSIQKLDADGKPVGDPIKADAAASPAPTGAAPTGGLAGKLDQVEKGSIKVSEDYSIKDGESIARIAQRYGITSRGLLDAVGPDGLTNEQRLEKQAPGLKRDRGYVYVVRPNEKILVPAKAADTNTPSANVEEPKGE
jgi:hypothetical protein